jgi:hypothetical protein
MYNEIKKSLQDAELQLEDWKATQPGDGYTQEYINGRIIGCRVSVLMFKRLAFKSKSFQQDISND